jgi:hypothetical protein
MCSFSRAPVVFTWRSLMICSANKPLPQGKDVLHTEPLVGEKLEAPQGSLAKA